LRRAAVERIDWALSSGDFSSHTNATRFNGLSSHASSNGAGSSASRRQHPTAPAPPQAPHLAPSPRSMDAIRRAERDSDYTSDPVFTRDAFTDAQRHHRRHADSNGDTNRAGDVRRRSGADATAATRAGKPSGRDDSPLTRIADRAARRGALLSQDGSQKEATGGDEIEASSSSSQARDSYTARRRLPRDPSGPPQRAEWKHSFSDPPTSRRQ